MRNVASIAFVLIACAGVARAEKPVAYQAGQPIPAGYHVERRTRWGLAASGLALFGMAYVPTAAAAFYDSGDGTPLYVVPILGPLFAIPGKTAGGNCENVDYPCGDWDGLVTAFLVADAVVQTVGVVMAWRGFAGEVLVRDGPPQAALVPGPIGADGYGAWLTGRF